MSIDLSLDRLYRLVKHLPTYTRPTCHIAGTNGKGSASSLLSSILRCSSLSVGRYNSPHLISVHDCISINNEPVKPDVYEEARAVVERANQEYQTGLSNFELLTLTALYIFEQEKVDVAVVEVGLGGRLDATNIIPDEAILVSALTAIDLDHQAFLGNTVAEIAKEKAGIARKGRLLILGSQKHGDVEGVVKSIVERIGGDFVRAVEVVKRPWDSEIDGVEEAEFSFEAALFKLPSPQPVEISLPCFSRSLHTLLPLYGDHQIDNLGTAATVISSLLTHPACAHLNLAAQITPEAVSTGIKAVRWPGRLSFHAVPGHSSALTQPIIVLADGAHNPASSSTLGSYVTHLLSLADKNKSINITYVLSLSHSPPKTPLQTLSPILPPNLPSNSNLKVNLNVAVLRFSPPEEMPWVKSVPPSVLHDVVVDLAPSANVWTAEEDSTDQLKAALEWAAEKSGGGLVVLAGSLYLVADFYRFIGGAAVGLPNATHPSSTAEIPSDT